MTQLTHPKLTVQVKSKFLKLYSYDQREARRFLTEALGVQKTQGYEWASRILGRNRDENPVDKVSDTAVSESSVEPTKRKIRRLFWDIETSPNVVFAWRTGYKINLSEDSIIHERKIICIGYKWEEDEEATVLRWDENQNDKQMLVEFLKVANEADEMVHQNGDQFDLPWFRTRCLMHGLQCMPDYKTCDILQWARRKFYFNSNKLDYMAKVLGLGSKIKTGFGLWREIVLNNCPEAMNKMTAYCGHDVILLQKVWNKLRLFVTPKTHAGVVAGREKYSCSHCGSDHVVKSKTKVTAAGTLNHQMQCKKCGGYTTINDLTYNKYKQDKGIA